MSQLFGDQYAFWPIRSTTAALIAIIQQITSILGSSSYVALITLDFSKAFDTVRHRTLAEKPSSLDIEDNVYNWTVNFLEDRNHVTRL